MSNIQSLWDPTFRKHKEIVDPKSLIIVYRDNETLKLFQEQYFKDYKMKLKANKTTFITYDKIKINEESVFIYSCACNDNGIDSISLAETLVKQQKTENIRWLILLDWSIYDQQSWYKHLNTCLEQLEKYPIINVVCINSEYIYAIQKNIPSWYSYHIDYIQQTLRWYCLNRNCNLIYTESKEDNFRELLDKFISNKFEDEDIEMAKTTKLIIPKGCDSLKLIKTLDDTFNEIDCNLEKFEEVIPAPVKQNISIDAMVPESEHFTISDSGSIEPDTPQFDSLDIQKELIKLKEHFKISNK